MSAINSGTPADNHVFLAGPNNADVATARTGPYHSASAGRIFTGVVSLPSVLEGTGVVLTLMQATSAGGAGAKALATTTTSVEVTASPPGTRSFTATVSARDSDLDLANGFAFIALRVDTDAATSGSGLIVVGNPRFLPA